MPVDTLSIVVCRDVGGLRQASAQSSSVLMSARSSCFLCVCAVLFFCGRVNANQYLAVYQGERSLMHFP